MPMIKIVQPGNETYTGIISGVRFENGLSIEPMNQADAERMGAFMRIVDADTDEPISPTHRMVQMRNQGVAPREGLIPIKRSPATGKVKEKKSEKLISYEYTRESLETAADAEGISGLRRIAEPYGVRGRSINEIIDSLMAIKSNAEAKAAAAANPATQAAEPRATAEE